MRNLSRWSHTPSVVSVTQTDNVGFTTLSMNPAAIRLDQHYAAGTEFGKPLMNSIFTLGLVVGLSVSDTTFSLRHDLA